MSNAFMAISRLTWIELSKKLRISISLTKRKTSTGSTTWSGRPLKLTQLVKWWLYMMKYNGFLGWLCLRYAMKSWRPLWVDALCTSVTIINSLEKSSYNIIHKNSSKNRVQFHFWNSFQKLSLLRHSKKYYLCILISWLSKIWLLTLIMTKRCSMKEKKKLWVTSLIIYQSLNKRPSWKSRIE